MQVVPVIDLKNGLAVHAVKGQREKYRPLQSKLCASPAPLAVMRGLLELHPFRSVYLADLDALTGKGHNRDIIHQLLGAFPHVEFWIDQGWPGEKAIVFPNHVPVLGSEVMRADHLAQLPRWQNRAILSLDFFGEGYTGPPALTETPELWPSRVILMTLARVGGNNGPDWERLDCYLDRYPQTCWIAAGGVRHGEDIRQLANKNVHAALLASALHSGQLTSSDLSEP